MDEGNSPLTAEFNACCSSIALDVNPDQSLTKKSKCFGGRRRNRLVSGGLRLRISRDKAADCECVIGKFSISFTGDGSSFSAFEALPYVLLDFVSGETILRVTEEEMAKDESPCHLQCRCDLPVSVMESLVKSSRCLYVSYKRNPRDTSAQSLPGFDLFCMIWLRSCAFMSREQYLVASHNGLIKRVIDVFLYSNPSVPYVRRLASDNPHSMADFYHSLKVSFRSFCVPMSTWLFFFNALLFYDDFLAERVAIVF
ncbi:unnamed protein product [Soboliphyme baturini]|uniref:SOCS box domain-containing protein n=1 Tax=Soboliphyme baturini TaxID=241478 RepID=A0A183J4Z0_9BILA|nr:unnamed protein product [Soboliphyme baturini]